MVYCGKSKARWTPDMVSDVADRFSSLLEASNFSCQRISSEHARVIEESGNVPLRVLV
jgi:hypothetical protein